MDSERKKTMYPDLYPDPYQSHRTSLKENSSMHRNLVRVMDKGQSSEKSWLGYSYHSLGLLENYHFL